MAINYIRPFDYIIEDSGEVVKEGTIPICFFYLILHKQSESDNRVIKFPEFGQEIPVSGI